MEQQSLSVIKSNNSVQAIGNNILSPDLVGKENEIAKALQGTRIKQIELEDVQIACADLITKAHHDCGFKTDDIGTDIGVMSVAFGLELKTYFNTISLEELRIAFYMGARKEFGEYMGLSLVTFYRWVQGYMGLSERISAKKKQAAFIASLNEPAPPTPQEVENVMKASVLRLFEDFKAGVKFAVFDVGNVHYLYLENLKLFKFTKERKIEIKAQAQKRLIERKELEKLGAANQVQREGINSAIAEIESGKADVVKIEARRLALETLFKDLIESGTELKDYIENANFVE